MANNFVKVIGGKWRSRLLKFPGQAGIKPTPNRIRETLFNWLSPVVPGACCLDLFAGSGALGIEALSRGAAWVGFVEASYRNASILSQQLSRLEADHESYVLYHQSYQQLTTEQILHQSFKNRPIDIIFLDPPFYTETLTNSLKWLSQQSFVSAEAYLYIECEKSFEFSEQLMRGWKPLKRKNSENVCYGLWVRK